MPLSHRFAHSPLFRAITVMSVAPLLLFSVPSLGATFLDGATLAIDGTTASDDYTLINGATLNAQGAQTGAISVGASTLNMSGSQVLGGSRTALDLQAGTAVIDRSVITADDIALVVSRNSDGSQGSTALISDSIITGGVSGAVVNGLSELTLINTTVTGTAGDGLQMFNGTVNATNSTISGGTNGVQMNFDPSVPSANTLTLRNSHVEGQNGSAILVDTLNAGVANAEIAVLDHSTLVGSNGIVLEVVNGATANLRVGNSDLVGDIVADGTSTANVTLENFATLTGRLVNVDSLAVNSHASWIMVGDGDIDKLSMGGGAIRFGSPNEFFKLSVGELSGRGTFIMHADFANGRVDTLEVTGNATGTHRVQMGSSGAEPTGASSLPVVHIGSGDATFTLLNGPVDLGAYAYDLVKRGENDWYLDTTNRSLSTGTRSVLALFNTAPTVWYGEMSTLRSRMGEVRRDGDKAGGWMRAYGNRFDVSSSAGVGYQQTQQGLSFGADAPLPMGDGQWLVGVLGGYSTSELDLDRGTSGKVDSYYVGAYTTWLDADSGYYLDGVLKFNRFQNRADVQLSDGTQTKGNYDNHGVGASLEFGRHIALGNDYFIEPFTQVSGLIVQGKDYALDNGLQAEGDATRSLLGKVGATLGRDFILSDGTAVQPYVRAAYVHEFARNNEVSVNGNAFDNNLAGSRGELGVGVAMSLTDKVSVHADFDYSNGDRIEQPWGANVGVRYRW